MSVWRICRIKGNHKEEESKKNTRKKSSERSKEENKERGSSVGVLGRVPTEMWATIWPVLGTIASYYVHNKRQWGHAKVTLPGQVGSSSLTKRTHGSVHNATIQVQERYETPLSVFPHKEHSRACVFGQRISIRIHVTYTGTVVCACTKATQTVANACSLHVVGTFRASSGLRIFPRFS